MHLHHVQGHQLIKIKAHITFVISTPSNEDESDDQQSQPATPLPPMEEEQEEKSKTIILNWQQSIVQRKIIELMNY